VNDRTLSRSGTPGQGFVRPVASSASEDGRLIERLATVRLVLLGEASHGTHEFYRERPEITKRLIERNAEWVPEEVPETFPTGV
jgi:hypothetical protein